METGEYRKGLMHACTEQENMISAKKQVQAQDRRQEEMLSASCMVRGVRMVELY